MLVHFIQIRCSVFKICHSIKYEVDIINMVIVKQIYMNEVVKIKYSFFNI